MENKIKGYLIRFSPAWPQCFTGSNRTGFHCRVSKINPGLNHPTGEKCLPRSARIIRLTNATQTIKLSHEPYTAFILVSFSSGVRGGDLSVHQLFCHRFPPVSTKAKFPLDPIYAGAHPCVFLVGICPACLQEIDGSNEFMRPSMNLSLMG